MDADRVDGNVVRAPTTERNTLVVENLQKSYGSRTVVRDGVVDGCKRRGGRIAWPERRRQDDVLYMVVGLLPLGQWPNCTQRTFDRSSTDSSPCAYGAVVSTAGGIGVS